MEKSRYSIIKLNLHSIFLLIQLYRGYWNKITNAKRVTTPKKSQETKQITTSPKEENAKYIPSPATEITETNNHLSLIPLNINGLNFSIKRHRLRDWIHNA